MKEEEEKKKRPVDNREGSRWWERMERTGPTRPGAVGAIGAGFGGGMGLPWCLFWGARGAGRGRLLCRLGPSGLVRVCPHNSHSQSMGGTAQVEKTETSYTHTHSHSRVAPVADSPSIDQQRTTEDNMPFTETGHWMTVCCCRSQCAPVTRSPRWLQQKANLARRNDVEQTSLTPDSLLPSPSPSPREQIRHDPRRDLLPAVAIPK